MKVGAETLVNAVMTLFAGRDPATLAAVRASIERLVDEAGPEALPVLNRRLAAAGADWDYYPRDPLARRLHQVLADFVLRRDSALIGVEHVHAVANRPVAIVANHLSYADANLLDVLLCRAGGASLADRLTAMAGPKVYTDPTRRFSSLCFGTIKTPQSSGRSSEDAVMSAREVARVARRVIDLASERVLAGEALLLFPEGTRSRTHAMQPMLTAVSRYFELPGLWLLPMGIAGTEALYPVGDDTVHPVSAVVRVGQAVEARSLLDRANEDRRLVMDAVGLLIAALLPPGYRGVYGDDATHLDDARGLVVSAVRPRP
jgi:1-acyl-sn-glycerol-3-phosphate acyltransferase